MLKHLAMIKQAKRLKVTFLEIWVGVTQVIKNIIKECYNEKTG